MKITGVATRIYAVDSARPALAKRSGVLTCEVQTDAGITGMSFTKVAFRDNAVTPELLKFILEKLLAPQIVDQDPHHYERIWASLFEKNHGIGRRGIVLHAISLIDICIWDILAKAADLPLYRYLGAARERVPVYANCAFHFAPDELAKQAVKYAQMGYRGVKFQGGFNSVDTETATARVKAVREAVGPDVGVMVDCNGSWDRETALRMLDEWKKYNLFWIEEPVSPDDIEGLALVAASQPTPVVTGEEHGTRYEFRQLIERTAIRIIQPDAGKVGGITELLKVANAAAVFSRAVAPHSLQEVHVHLAAALPNAYIQEYFLDDSVLHEAVHTILDVDDARYDFDPKTCTIRPPQEPGLGLKLKSDAEKYRVA